MELSHFENAVQDFETALTICTEPKEKINIETSLASAKSHFSSSSSKKIQFERTILKNANLW